MPATIQFWFDFASTYSYPAAMRIERQADAAGVAVAWKPFLLGPIFASQGWNDSPFNIYPPKGRYMWRDLERLCDTDGIPLLRPSRFPRNGLLAARVANRFATAPWAPEFCRAIFRANFAEDREIADPAVVRDCLDRLGLSGETLIDEAQSLDGKAALRDAVERAGRSACSALPASSWRASCSGATTGWTPLWNGRQGARVVEQFEWPQLVGNRRFAPAF